MIKERGGTTTPKSAGWGVGEASGGDGPVAHRYVQLADEVRELLSRSEVMSAAEAARRTRGTCGTCGIGLSSLAQLYRLRPY